MKIDFDEWADLYKTDPVEFERRRKAVLATAIDAAPEHRQPALYETQRAIDQFRADHTPTETLLMISRRLQDTLFDLQDQMLNLCIASKVIQNDSAHINASRC